MRRILTDVVFSAFLIKAAVPIVAIFFTKNVRSCGIPVIRLPGRKRPLLAKPDISSLPWPVLKVLFPAVWPKLIEFRKLKHSRLSVSPRLHFASRAIQ